MMWRGFLALMLIPFPTLAQQSVTLREPLKETVRESAEISGASVLGLTVPGPAEEEPELSVWFPADWAGGPACVHVTSADGLYEAEGDYDVPATWGGGVAQLSYPSKKPDVVSRIGGDAVAVSVSRGTCDAEEEGPRTQAFWNAGAGTPHLLVNGYRADEVLVLLPVEVGGETVACRRSGAAMQAAFDTVCPRPAAVANRTVTVEILRIRDMELDPTISATFHFAPR